MDSELGFRAHVSACVVWVHGFNAIKRAAPPKSKVGTLNVPDVPVAGADSSGKSTSSAGGGGLFMK
jgi:hypothetical protein